MATYFECEKLEKKSDKLLVKTNPVVEMTESIRATGQMLVDSKQLAFIYILDDETGYKYVVFNQNTWPILQEHIAKNLSVFISNDDGEIELTAFYMELAYLLSNIKDNPNYGDKMTEEVERIFY